MYIHRVPVLSMQVRGADLSLSPVHSAARGLVPDINRGIGLRFPRFIRIRDDKSPEDASDSHQVLDLFLQQARRPRGRA